MSQLNPNRPDPAYLCGRLLAVLEEIQEKAADGKINTTIVDRYYGTASTAPATVFGRLIHLSQHHLGKLRSTKWGNKKYQKKLSEVLGGLDEFPTTLSLPKQGLFALGYYHERADRFTKKTNNGEGN